MLTTVDAVEATTDHGSSEPAEDRESEAKLTSEITALWSAHQDGKATAKRTRAELKELRRNLGERLRTMKNLLARTGRGGQWMGYLREQKIPRTTADRYISDHEKSLNPEPENRITGAISAPTEEDVKQFFHRLLPRLQSVLTSYDAVYYFVREMHFELSNCNSEHTDRGILVLGPAQKGESQ